MDIYSMIKLAALNAIKSAMNTDVFTGMVEELDFDKEEQKILIRLSDKIVIDENMLVFLNNCQKSIKEGDSVLLVSSADGQTFYCLGEAGYIEETEEAF